MKNTENNTAGLAAATCSAAWSKARPTIDGWWWYWPPGTDPEIVRVAIPMCRSSEGYEWRITGMAGKWCGPLMPPNDKLTDAASKRLNESTTPAMHRSPTQRN